jgi:hypothetical protein
MVNTKGSVAQQFLKRSRSLLSRLSSWLFGRFQRCAPSANADRPNVLVLATAETDVVRAVTEAARVRLWNLTMVEDPKDLFFGTSEARILLIDAGVRRWNWRVVVDALAYRPPELLVVVIRPESDEEAMCRGAYAVLGSGSDVPFLIRAVESAWIFSKYGLKPLMSQHSR